MDPSALRHALAAFLGDDQFRKLVRQSRRAGRLRFWQEEALARFADARPGLRFGPDDLHAALRVCELHGCELLPDTAEVIDACVDYADWSIRAKAARFPNAASGPVSTEGAPLSAVSGAVWFCPACRRAESEWKARRER